MHWLPLEEKSIRFYSPPSTELARQVRAAAPYISHRLLTDKGSGVIQPWKYHCLQVEILTYKFSLLLSAITVLLAFLRQLYWPISSSTFKFFLPRKPPAAP